MKIDPDRDPDKAKGAEVEKGPQFQRPPQKKFEPPRQREERRLPSEKEVVETLKQRVQERRDGQPEASFARQPPPSAPPPSQPRPRESGEYFPDEMDSQQSNSSQQTPSHRKPVKQKEREKEKPEIKKKDQKPTEVKGKDQKPGEVKGEKKALPGAKKHPTSKGKAGTAQSQQAPQVAQQAPPGAAGSGVAMAQAPQTGGTGTSIDQIISIFQNNPVLGARMASFTVAAKGAETQIAVTLTNGVNVEVNLAAGGKDLNIVIRGITAELQAKLDMRESQLFLQSKLSEKGFVVHQVQTFRGEQPQAPTPPRTFEREREEGGGGGREEPPEEEEE